MLPKQDRTCQRISTKSFDFNKLIFVRKNDKFIVVTIELSDSFVEN